MKFAIRPNPEAHEGLNGYLMRVAYLGGWRRISDVTKLLQWSGKANFSRVYKDTCNDLLLTAAPALLKDASQLSEALITTCDHPYLYDENRMIQDIRVDYPRVCFHCLAEDKKIDWRWSLLPIFQCQKHGSVLQDSCLECGYQFKWESELLERCPACGSRWEPLATKPQPVTESQKYVWSVFESSKAPSSHVKGWLRDICLSTLIAARPFDSMYQKIGSIPSSVRNISNLVQAAYSQLIDPLYQNQWKERLFEERAVLASYSNEASLYSSKYLAVNSVTEWPLSTALLSPNQVGFNESEVFVKPVRRKLMKVCDLRYQVTNSHVAELLKLHNSDISILVDAGVISPINSKSSTMVQLFDLLAVYKLLESIPLNENLKSIDTINITPKSALLNEYAANFGQLIADVLSGKVDGVFSKAGYLKEISIDRSKLMPWLFSQLKITCENSVSLHTAAAILKCSERCVLQLSKSMEIQLAKWGGPGRERVDGLSLLAHKLPYSA
ncbi:TniQ family protein [Amphritea sp.]|uniref:TniQ family protein n=1 Tax=Amphritea sp. TaxID=1872502 RepID=UPI003D14EB40